MTQNNYGLTPPPSLNLEERKALVWFRTNEPASPDAPGAPEMKMRVHLMQRGLIHFWPGRKRFDPPVYSLTASGKEALQ
jgi:hypothetical protein